MKNQKIILFSVTALILISTTLMLFVISCSKEKEVSLEKTSNEDIVFKTSKDQLERDTDLIISSFEKVGKMHNEMLTRIGNYPSFGKLSKNEIYNICLTVLNENDENTTNIISEDNAVDLLLNDNDTETLSMIADKQLSTGRISDMCNKEIKILEINILSSKSFDVLEKKLIVFEKNIINKSNLTLEEKKIIISTSILTRYSGKFWDEAFNDKSNPWHNIVRQETLNIHAMGPIPDGPSFFRDIRGWLVGFFECGWACGRIVGGLFSGEGGGLE